MKNLLKASDILQEPHPQPFKCRNLDVQSLKKFITNAVQERKQPIVIFGANWCPDARLLEAVLQLPSVQSFLNPKCNILNVDVGDYEINTELFKYFDPEIESGIDSNDKMRTARQQSPQEIFDYFQDFIAGN